MADFVALAYGVGVTLAAIFAAYAFLYGWWWARQSQGNKDTEVFITARGTQSLWRIGWSFYAGAVGAWVIVAPSQYACFSGIVGVVVYALASGLPVLLVAAFGDTITARMPHVFSLADFIGWRFGPVAKTLVVLVAMFNMSIALLAEYTTIGAIFSDFVGSVSYGIIAVVGVLTLLYTAYGGLAVSIATDQAQGVASALLALVLLIYVSATYRTPIPRPLPEGLGPVPAGWIAIFTLGASLVSSTFFSEAMWQRVWASAGRRQLFGGAAVGCCGIICIVFLSGFGGWLALVGGYTAPDPTNNTILMQVLRRPGDPVTGLHNWVGLLVVLLAVAMNESAVDSLQNGLAASISGHFLKNSPLVWTRAVVVVLNIPLIIIGTRGYAVLSLFLVTNLVTCCAILPLIGGLVPGWRPFVTETGFVFGFVCGVLGVTATGIGMRWNPDNVAASFAEGANWAWYGSNYDWAPFVAALACSSLGGLAWCSAAWLLRTRAGVRGPGVSGVIMRLPGARLITASPDWTPQAAGDSASSLGGGHARARGSGGAAAAAAAAGKDVLAAPV